MLFRKWFGKHREEDDEEPTAQAAPVARAPDTPRAKPPLKTDKPDAQGFDPYNSGAFQRSNAWERVNRR